ncbi:nuclear transport factor 2 family protein [Streptomyces sp. NPDC048436]|uniref:nuclear transport factor 2 family protein n=1 Tax=Streptomyces sp. NPDC048436 TaxID=3365550 RepID=UPI0037113D64
MTTPLTPAEDFVGYLRSYTADSFDPRQSLEDVWDRYHVPDATHVVNRKERDRAAALKSLSQWRADQSPYELWIHEAVVDGRRAAARYTISKVLLMQVRHNTEVVIFADLADDGRVASTVTTARSTYGWGGADSESWDADARSVATAPPGAAADPELYLTTFAHLTNDPAVPLDEAFDRFHTPDAVQYINGASMQRPAVLQSLAVAREKGPVYDLEIHASVRQGKRFAARYSMVPSDRGRRAGEMEVFTFGEFADDGRVRLLRSVMQTKSGYWPT